MKYIVYDLQSGQVNGNCSFCGVYGVQSQAHFDIFHPPNGHGKYLLTEEEEGECGHFDRENNCYMAKIDTENKRIITRSEVRSIEQESVRRTCSD